MTFAALSDENMCVISSSPIFINRGLTKYIYINIVNEKTEIGSMSNVLPTKPNKCSTWGVCHIASSGQTHNSGFSKSGIA